MGTFYLTIASLHLANLNSQNCQL